MNKGAGKTIVKLESWINKKIATTVSPHKQDIFVYQSKLKYMIPKVELDAGKAALFREILDINDLQDISLLDEYHNLFLKSQNPELENEGAGGNARVE